MKAYKNTGAWGGHILEVGGTKIQFNDGSLHETIESLDQASRYRIEKNVGGTAIKGDSNSVYLDDTQDNIKLTNREAREAAETLKEYALKQVAAMEAAKKL